MQTCQNNLGFSLYTMLSICHVVTILENWTESKVKVSADIGILPFVKFKNSGLGFSLFSFSFSIFYFLFIS